MLAGAKRNRQGHSIIPRVDRRSAGADGAFTTLHRAAL
jgi:hypothetical protein